MILFENEYLVIPYVENKKSNIFITQIIERLISCFNQKIHIKNARSSLYPAMGTYVHSFYVYQKGAKVSKSSESLLWDWYLR